ncbi:MAG: hypothetical protein QOI34_854 [Verrucomicrobiota bacterium]
MKMNIVLAIALGLILVPVSRASAADRLGASEQEMERLKQLNQSKTVVSQSDDELKKMMVGKWTTGRHEYIYNANGTWQMLPLDISTTHGTWRIQNHQLIEDMSGARTFIEAKPKQLVLRNEQGPYPYRYVKIQ